ncbi:hypothetical protein [Streptomyces sp. NPDC056682]|uniref:hypothetical protein n=1 Tax=Streptomyces sp. NPDC056682 TaxID=3345909 RepID=UPI00367E03B4
MKTVFMAYRVTHLDRSLGFHTALGNVELGRQDGQFTEVRLLDSVRKYSSIRAGCELGGT